MYYTTPINRAFTLTAPAGLGWTPPILPRWTPHGWRGNVSARTLRPALVAGSDATYYVDPLWGSDAAAGTDVAPLQTIEIALEKADAGTVIVAPGLYKRDLNIGTPSYAANSNPIRIVRWAKPGAQGPVYITSAYTDAELGWVANGTHPTAYDAAVAVSAFGQVVDLGISSNDGGFMQYREAATLAECGAARGSWFLTGTTLTVHPMRDGAPDIHVLCLRGEANAYHNVAKPLYCDGLTFVGGDQAMRLGTVAAGAIFVDCKFLHSGTGNGLYVQADADVIAERCTASWNANDGFNYSTATTGRFIEINCTALNNGTTNVGSQNGTSSHSSFKGLRIGGHYAGNHGANVADINTTKQWGVGCRGDDSRWQGEQGGALSDDDVIIANTVEAWLYACTFRSLRIDDTAVAYGQHCEITEGEAVTAYEQAFA
jgi:hypothetical protein